MKISISQVLHLYSSVHLQKFSFVDINYIHWDTIASTVELSVELGSGLTVFRYISGCGTAPLAD